MPSLTLAERLKIFTEAVTVYPVSCEKLANGRSDLEWLAAVLAGGARIVQLRDKESNDRELLEKALAFRRMTSATGALFIVNNRLDIALLSDADGVHLGNSDLPVEAARRLDPELIIGVSANSVAQAATARERGASYFNVGPLYPTATKTGLKEFLGPQTIPAFRAVSTLPCTVMGGIKLQHVSELVAYGARRLAVVTALSQSPDITAETGRWIAAITTARTGV